MSKQDTTRLEITEALVREGYDRPNADEAVARLWDQGFDHGWWSATALLDEGLGSGAFTDEQEALIKAILLRDGQEADLKAVFSKEGPAS